MLGETIYFKGNDGLLNKGICMGIGITNGKVKYAVQVNDKVVEVKQEDVYNKKIKIKETSNE